MNSKLLRLIKKPLFLILVVEIIIIIVFIAFGFRIVYAPRLKNDWEAISAVGQWANVVVAIIIPIVVAVATYVFTKKIEESKRDIGQSNVETVTEVETIKKEIEAIKKVYYFNYMQAHKCLNTSKRLKKFALKIRKKLLSS